MRLKDDLEEIFDIEDITPKHLQDIKTGPLNNKVFKKIRSEKSSTDAYPVLLTNYASSPLRDSEIYLRYIVGLHEDDIHLIIKQYNSKIVPYEIPVVIYSNKDTSDFVYNMEHHKGALQNEYDDVSVETKLILSSFVMLRFNEKSFLKTF